VTALLRQWSAGKDAPEDDSPEKLLYPLEHAYTPAEVARLLTQNGEIWDGAQE
jgi:hypothetical protein